MSLISALLQIKRLSFPRSVICVFHPIFPALYFGVTKRRALLQSSLATQSRPIPPSAPSPEAGILAMGHQSTGGISVYQFNPDELTLKRIWVVE
ncbi:MAG: hypothetical protein ACI90S_000074 [Marinobacter psychrophilus]